METEKYAPHTIPGTQEQYTRLCTTKSMEDVPYLTICMYISRSGSRRFEGVVPLGNSVRTSSSQW